MHGSISRISDGKDIENLILESGWGYVKEEIKNSLLAAKFETLEKKAREKGKGLYKKEKKDLGIVRFEDLSKPKTVNNQDFYL